MQRRGGKKEALLLMLALSCLSACAPSPGDRIGRVYAWKARPTPQNLEKIRAYVKDPDRDVRVIALEALVSEGAEDAVALSVQALEDPDPYVRTAAARSLGELHAESAIPKLVALLAHDPDPLVRRRAAEAAARLGGPIAIEALVGAIDDPTREVRRAAVRGSGELDPDAAYEALARIVLEDPDWQTRVDAARALGRANRPEAKAALESAQQDTNEFVRAAVAAALRAPHAPVSASPPEVEASVPRRTSGGR